MLHHLKSHQRKLFWDKAKPKILTLLIIFNLLSIIYYLLSISSVFASTEFSVRQNVAYRFDQNGNCNTTHTVNLENKLSNIYATQYSLTITGERIRNIKALDNQNQPLRTEIDQSARHLTKATIFFDNPTAGKGKSQTFTFSYSITEYAKREGQTWRVIVPKIENIENLDDVSLEIRVPNSFGSLSFVSPKNYVYEQTATEQIIKFNKRSLTQKEAMAIFGNAQSFQFTLKYYLENDHSTEKKGSIALPPDTGYQKIYLNNIDPLPEDVETDSDGNWLAIYPISANSNLEITVQGLAQIAADPAPPPLPPQNINDYLADQLYWEKNNPQIQELAQELKTPKKIYEFVTQTLQYNFERVKNKNIKRQGAVQALNNPNDTICTEFTDLFIALARAAGIPAREINGYAYSTNPQLLPLAVTTDILHAWPEYWDNSKQVWIQVDPTWENTSNIDYFNKLDMTHLAFVIHGQNSQTPLPAGAYQNQNNLEKNIFVSFATPPDTITSQNPQLYFDLPDKLSPQQQTTGYLEINNINSLAAYNQEIRIWGENIVGKEVNKKIVIIPPFGKKRVKFTVKNNNILRNDEAKVLAAAKTQGQEEQTISQTISLESIFTYRLTLWGILLLALCLLLGLLIIKYRKQKTR